MAQVEQLYTFALDRRQFEKIRTLTLAQLSRMIDLSRTAVARAVTPSLALPGPPRHQPARAPIDISKWSAEASLSAAKSRTIGSGAEVNLPHAGSRARWPPQNGRDYVRSDAFGRLLLDVIEPLAREYSSHDFVDAAAEIFTWLDTKLRTNRRFINARRFPTEADFRAYLRQAAWNAARMAARRLKAHETLPAAAFEIDLSLDPVTQACLQESLERLVEPHKTVLERLFFENDDLEMVASILGKTPTEVETLYAEAIDLLKLEP